MTIKSEIVAITSTASARAAIQAKGTNVDALMTLAQQHAIELRALIAQIVAFTPGGDANLTALNNLLAELL